MVYRSVLVVSIVRFVFVLELDLSSEDVTWDECTEMKWTGVEVNIGTVCGMSCRCSFLVAAVG